MQKLILGCACVMVFLSAFNASYGQNEDLSTKTGTIEGATLTYLAKTPFAPPGGYCFSLKEFGSNVQFYMTVQDAIKYGVMSKDIADSIKPHDPDQVGRTFGMGPAFPRGFTQYVIQQDLKANGLIVKLQHENINLGKGKITQYRVVSIKKIKQPENKDDEQSGNKDKTDSKPEFGDHQLKKIMKK